MSFYFPDVLAIRILFDSHLKIGLSLNLFSSEWNFLLKKLVLNHVLFSGRTLLNYDGVRDRLLRLDSNSLNSVLILGLGLTWILFSWHGQHGTYLWYGNIGLDFSIFSVFSSRYEANFEGYEQDEKEPIQVEIDQSLLIAKGLHLKIDFCFIT